MSFVAVAPTFFHLGAAGRLSTMLPAILVVMRLLSWPFDLSPDFFAGVPYRQGLQLRFQAGSDFETYSDGVSILLYDISQVRPDPSTGFAGKYGQPLAVSPVETAVASWVPVADHR